ncbi:MAG: DUF3455 domain-containing protein [Methylocella sp.]
MKRIAIAIALGSFIAAGFIEQALAVDALAAPSGTKLALEAYADGVQVYVCTAKEKGFAWVFDGPAATLFNARGREIGTHGKGPMWTLGDGSAITGEGVGKKDSPKADSIAWLLLKVNSHAGTYGQLSNVTYVRRIDTKGGSEPADGCDSHNQGDIARIRYSATYQFYAP